MYNRYIIKLGNGKKEKKEQKKEMENNRRFENNLNENYGITLLKFSYNGITFKIRSTEHSLLRFKEKGIDVDIACGDIVALGKARLYNYAKTGDDVAIIDVKNKITTITTFEGSQIRIRTIIPRSNTWIKQGTRIYKLNERSFGR